MDDEAEVRDVLTELLELDGHRVEAVGSGEEALARLRRRRYDVVQIQAFLEETRLPHLAKPVALEALRQAVAQVCGAGGASDSA